MSRRSVSNIDASMTAQLTLITGPGVGKVFPLDCGATTIGRLDSAHVQLTDEGISRNHAQIRHELDGGYVLHDAGSRNGSFVNGGQVRQPHRLHDGDEIRFGVLTLLKFSSADEEIASDGDWSDSDTISSSADSLFQRLFKEGSAGPPLLVSVSGEAAGRVHRLDRGRVTLGRDEQAEVQIKDAGISRRHAAITRRDDGSHTLEDLGSSNGTFANQQRVEQPFILRDGDMIQLGTMTVLRFVSASGPEGALARALDDRGTPQEGTPVGPDPCSKGTLAGPTAEVEGHELKKELALARKVQMAMVPPDGALFDKAGAFFSGVVRSASFTAGDLWTHVETDNRLFLLIADVTGHGVGPAMITTVAKSCLDTVLLRAGDFSLEQVFDTMNRVILGISKRTLVMTAFAVEIDAAAGELAFCSAGHIPQVLLRRSEAEVEVTPLFTAQTSALGESLDSEFVIQRRAYQAGDRLVLFTDGLLEAPNRRGNAYGNRRLHAFLRDKADLELKELLGMIITELETYTESAPPEDDVTVVVAELKVGAGEKKKALIQEVRTNPGFALIRDA
jgi:pSer/pThr/pTyr-binding forkhead associated (FHA) protein